MRGFIVVTIDDYQPVYINICNIASIFRNDDGYTHIQIIDGSWYTVSETIEQITNMINRCSIR